MFTLKIFRGPRLRLGCALASHWSICNAYKNSRGQHPQGQKYSLSKSPLGWVNMSGYNFFVSGPKFTLFSPNVGGVVVDKAGLLTRPWAHEAKAEAEASHHEAEATN